MADVQGEAARQILVESYIPGGEVALEGLLHDGELEILALFDKPEPLVGPYFEETLFVTPSRLPATVRHDIAQAARQAVAALGLRHGPVHAEFRVNEKGVWPLEMAARSIGGLCARSLNFGPGPSGSSRLGLEALLLRHALGLPIFISKQEQRPSGVMMIPTPESGILREVRGLEEARAVAGIEDITISIVAGQPVAPPPEGYRYLGFIFAQGDSPDAVEAALRSAHAKLEIVIDKN